MLSTHFLILSHHVLSCYHAVKSMVDVPHYFRTEKRAKRSRKFNAGVLIKKTLAGQKVKGHLPSDNPAAAFPGYVEW